MSSHLSLVLPKGHFPISVTEKNLKALLISSILAKWPAHLNFLDLITLNILDERHKLWSSSLWNLLHSSSLLLFEACKDIGLAVNRRKTKYMEIGRHRGMIANEHIRIGSNYYEKVKVFKYLGSLVTNQNSIQEEIKKNVDLKQEILVIIQPKHFCLFSKNIN